MSPEAGFTIPAQTATYIVAALFGTIYAIILSTKTGRKFSGSESTSWIATSIGILLVWLSAYLTGGEFTLLLFVFAGFPLAVRSAVISERRHREGMEKAFDG